jgi:hypothetical protein
MRAGETSGYYGAISKSLPKRSLVGIGGVVAVEWPEMNEYWKQPDVVEFLKKFNFNLSWVRVRACCPIWSTPRNTHGEIVERLGQ